MSDVLGTKGKWDYRGGGTRIRMVGQRVDRIPEYS